MTRSQIYVAALAAVLSFAGPALSADAPPRHVYYPGADFLSSQFAQLTPVQIAGAGGAVEAQVRLLLGAPGSKGKVPMAVSPVNQAAAEQYAKDVYLAMREARGMISNVPAPDVTPNLMASIRAAAASNAYNAAKRDAIDQAEEAVLSPIGGICPIVECNDRYKYNDGD
jgi:hypothetical protein